MLRGHIVTRAARQNPQFHQLRPTPSRRFQCRLLQAVKAVALLALMNH